MMSGAASAHITLSSSSLSWLREVALVYQYLKQFEAPIFALKIPDSSPACINDRLSGLKSQLSAPICVKSSQDERSISVCSLDNSVLHSFTRLTSTQLPKPFNTFFIENKKLINNININKNIIITHLLFLDSPEISTTNTPVKI
ncbi:hypothetical protein BpHYR1_007763 [Brachionus plicatilis]|uniref:Uncharacterized protein n=1 Tax=Brachionus plicatilis TaxID=10195 RepID=A0A3M7QGU4_BRAPC|nr:hypothetical protein BpHYR1_007763 [Brachionus plicatilis]